MAIKPVTDVLRKIRKGKLLKEMDIGFNDLIRQVQATGKVGSMTIKVDVKPMKATDEMVQVGDKLSFNTPKHDINTAFFVTNEGNLQTSHPDQGEDEIIRSVGSGEEKIKKVAND